MRTVPVSVDTWNATDRGMPRTVHGLHQMPGGLSSPLHEGAAPSPLGAVCSESHPALPPGCLLANPPVHTLPPLLCVFLTQKGRLTVVNTSERRLDVFKKQMILKHLDFGVSVTLGGKKKSNVIRSKRNPILAFQDVCSWILGTDEVQRLPPCHPCRLTLSSHHWPFACDRDPLAVPLGPRSGSPGKLFLPAPPPGERVAPRRSTACPGATCLFLRGGVTTLS